MRLSAPLLAVATLAALGAESTPAAAATPQVKQYVLVIANNRSLDKGVRPLRYADDDGVRYYEMFQLTGARVALFSVLDDETARLYPEIEHVARPPRAAAIFDTLARWNRQIERDHRAGFETELFFIYAGHGDRDAAGEGYVNLLDGKLRRRDLYQRVLAPARATFVHLLIDACKSYYMVNRRGSDAKDGATVADEMRAFLDREELSAYPNAGVVVATSGDQATHEWTRYHSGILSHELRSAISGAGDINGDGRVEYSELHAFIAAANARVKHPEATLHIFVRPPAADRRRPLMDLRRSAGSRLLRFDRALSGRFHLEDERGVRVADLHKPRGTAFDVAVDRRRAYYLRRKDGETRIAAGRSRVAVASLDFAPASSAARSGSLDSSFRRELFGTAFSSGFYEGFCAQTGHLAVEASPVSVIEDTPDEQAPATGRHALYAGYIASSALLELPGASHGLQLGYQFGLHEYFALGATVELARSSHQGVGETFSVDRLAVLIGAAGRARVLSWLEARAELAIGYQGYFGSGAVELGGRRIEGSDPVGARLEAGLGARLSLGRHLFVDLRGGLGVELVTIEPDERTHTAPYFAAGLGTSL